MTGLSKEIKKERKLMKSVNKHWCYNCKQYLDKSDFYLIGRRCKECDKKYKKEYYKKNKDKVKQNVMKYYNRTKNNEKIKNHKRKYHREYNKKKRKTDISFRINENFSRSIRDCLSKNKNGRSWESIVGYTLSELKVHLTGLFIEGMSWENWGNGNNKWNIDHIIPMKYKKENGEYYWNQIELSSPKTETFKLCWSLSNLQPKWFIDNIKKKNTYIG